MPPAHTAERLIASRAPLAVYQLAQKIEWGDEITDNDVAPVKMRVNDRYGEEITLLFLALKAKNLSAIDKLLKYGADPYAVARPSQNSSFSFATALGYPDKEFLNPCIRLYLKYGGNPNYRMPDEYQTPLINDVALVKNYDGFWLLVEAGADPWADAVWPDKRFDNAMLILARSLLAYKELNKLIDMGYFNEISHRVLARFMVSLSGYSQRGDEISFSIQNTAKRILKIYPNYPDDESVKRIFGNPVPAEVRQ